jgi:hypothetical protein
MKGTLLEENVPYWLYHALLYRDHSKILHPLVSAHALQIV